MWEFACQWYGSYTREEFIELPGPEQARIVALYQIRMQMSAIEAKELSEGVNRGG